MTRPQTVFAFALMGAILIVTSARADESTGAGGKARKAGGDQSLNEAAIAGLQLLQIDQVRADLEISGEQEQKLIALSLNQAATIEDLKKKAVQILTPQQRKRLRELHLQSLGPTALGDLAVAKALSYTPEQCQMVKALPARVRQATLEALQGAETAKERIERTKAAYEKVFQSALEALTPEQREKFEKMRGPKINVDFSDASL